MSNTISVDGVQHTPSRSDIRPEPGANTIRLEQKGVTGRVFLPDGTELRRVLDAKVSIGPNEVATLTLVLTDFTVTAQL